MSKANIIKKILNLKIIHVLIKKNNKKLKIITLQSCQKRSNKTRVNNKNISK